VWSPFLLECRAEQQGRHRTGLPLPRGSVLETGSQAIGLISSASDQRASPLRDSSGFSPASLPVGVAQRSTLSRYGCAQIIQMQRGS